MSTKGEVLRMRVGETWRLDYGPGNQNNKTIHVRANVDGEWVVLRKWSARNGWVYWVEHAGVLANVMADHLTRVRGQRPTRVLDRDTETDEVAP